MYVPAHFRQDDRAEMHALINASRLATLITVSAGVPLVSHLPMILEASGGENGTLLCHLARANPQWRTIGESTEALVIFLGPDAYVSPSWYESKRDHGKVVPTWNYVAVHAYGPVRVIEDPVWLRGLVERLTRKHEGGRSTPWAVGDAPAPFIETQLRAIGGFEIPIRPPDRKWKLRHNRLAADA